MENLIVLEKGFHGRTCIGTAANHEIIDVWHSDVIPGDHDAKELARRLTASFNACKGIGIELLERFTVEDTLNEAYTNRVKVEKLEAQNAQLLEALIMAKEEIAVAIAKATQSPETTTP